ncbi:hypothetical protein KFL_002110040 [Klebsormidium nitens]|uniref:Uncharacterized protein n=1 Tax=Klebsormidium nitens TaxID=105231 RepID=A0A1Y1I1T9_KLENI|nr:hypothetical protein KFL_002110040 [Klebsormidium nitens]|eukprot:GAQ84890.1 hypothetical protein KFL_002110040 [Klebsormidium nitens]
MLRNPQVFEKNVSLQVLEMEWLPHSGDPHERLPLAVVAADGSYRHLDVYSDVLRAHPRNRKLIRPRPLKPLPPFRAVPLDEPPGAPASAGARFENVITAGVAAGVTGRGGGGAQPGDSEQRTRSRRSSRRLNCMLTSSRERSDVSRKGLHQAAQDPQGPRTAKALTLLQPYAGELAPAVKLIRRPCVPRDQDVRLWTRAERTNRFLVRWKASLQPSVCAGDHPLGILKNSLIWPTHNGSPHRAALVGAGSIFPSCPAQPGCGSRPVSRKPTTTAGSCVNQPPHESPSPGDQPSLPSAAPPYKRADNTPAYNTPADNTSAHNTPADNTSAHNTPADNTSAHNTPADNNPAYNTSADTPLEHSLNRPNPPLSSTPLPSNPSPPPPVPSTPLPTSASGSPPLQSNPPPKAVPLSPPTNQPTPPSQTNSPPSITLPSNSPPPSNLGLASSPPPKANPPPKATSSTPPPQSVPASPPPTLTLSQPPPLKANPPPLLPSPSPKVPPPQSPVPSSPPPTASKNPPPVRNPPPLQANPPPLLQSPTPKVPPPQSPVPSSPPPTASQSPPPPGNSPPLSGPPPPKVALSQPPPTQGSSPPKNPPPKGSMPQSFPPPQTKSPTPPLNPPPSQALPPPITALTQPPPPSANPPPQAKASTPPVNPPTVSTKNPPPPPPLNPPPLVLPGPNPPPPRRAPPPPPVRRCRSTSDCALNKGCCTEQYTGKVGVCTNVPVLSNGTQVCSNCNVFNGPTCPPEKGVCCATGECKASANECPCYYSQYYCPTGFCCREYYSGNEGTCTDTLILSNGTQACPNCNDFNANGLACPDNKPFCCPTGGCAADESACTCESNGQCPSGYCCTGDYRNGTTGHCTNAPFDSSGAQVCPQCQEYNGVSCPANKGVCCRQSGECVSDVEACPCPYSSYYCPQDSCCTGYYVDGHCSSTAFFSNGTQECANCNDFNGLSCPTNKKVCCPNGQCAATNAGCTCTYSGQCPSNYCCTEESSGKTGRCVNAPFNSSGKQVCPNCNNLNGLSCPASKGTCCASGQCVASPTSCPCISAGYCPYNTCCSREYDYDSNTGTYKQGTCYDTPVLANGTQVCPQCNSFNGLSCPASKSFCCPNHGECAASESGCKCEAAGYCPSGFCCSEEYSGNLGSCTNTPILSNGTQICKNCNNLNGASCPASKPVCCPLGDCAASEADCSCQYASQCPYGYCCTKENGEFGKCVQSPVDPATGDQVCPYCYSFNGASCPADKSFCCPRGNCAESEGFCGCQAAGYCPTGYCCSEEYSGNPGFCTNTPVSSNGTQICPQCNDFNGAACPATKKVCCPNGQCAASGAACTCQYSSECPTGYCCTEESSGKTGKCTNAPINSSGKQVCPDCTRWSGLSCPAGKGTCCPTGQCAASESSCTCISAGYCPPNNCCSREYEYTVYPNYLQGTCYNTPVLANGTQICPDCNDLNGLSCPASKPVCCQLGNCVASGADCSCRTASNCPSGYCCTKENGELGKCVQSPIDPATGNQVCPYCSSFNGASCPSNKPFCCNRGYGECAASESACKCEAAGHCSTGYCCTEEYTGNQGLCTNTPVVTNGTQVCANCNTFNGASCPADKSVCCPLGTCAASNTGCTCRYSGDCPSGFCCTEYYSGKLGVCTNTPVLANGTQVCPYCGDFNAMPGTAQLLIAAPRSLAATLGSARTGRSTVPGSRCAPTATTSMARYARPVGTCVAADCASLGPRAVSAALTRFDYSRAKGHSEDRLD